MNGGENDDKTRRRDLLKKKKTNFKKTNNKITTGKEDGKGRKEVFRNAYRWLLRWDIFLHGFLFFVVVVVLKVE